MEFSTDENGDRVPKWRIDEFTGETEIPVIHRHTESGVFLRAVWADGTQYTGRGIDMEAVEARTVAHMSDILNAENSEDRVRARIAAVEAGDAVPLAGVTHHHVFDIDLPESEETETQAQMRARLQGPGNPDVHIDFSDPANYDENGVWIHVADSSTPDMDYNSGSREWRHANDGSLSSEPLTEDQKRAYHRWIHRETNLVVRWARSIPVRFKRSLAFWKWSNLYREHGDALGIFVLIGLVAFIGFMLNVMELRFN